MKVEFPFVSSISVAMQCAVVTGRNWSNLSETEREHIKNILLNIAEIVSNDEDKVSKWEDIADMAEYVLGYVVDGP